MRYCVAEHYFTVDAQRELMRKGYEPFSVSNSDTGTDLFRLTVVETPIDERDFELEMSQQDDGQVIEAGHIGSRPTFRFGFHGRMTGTMVCSEDYRKAELSMMGEESATLDNALMVLYALAAADKATLLMHASVTVKDGHGFLFVAPSGTGKSTHSSLWLKYIDDSWLLNDDNPIVRIMDGRAMVYGSPWSGKTPCYKNEQCPVGAIVRIVQAPKNKIRRVKGIEAYARLAEATSGKRWDQRLADGLHETLNWITMQVPFYVLDCLPDEASAKLCFIEITREKK